MRRFMWPCVVVVIALAWVGAGATAYYTELFRHARPCNLPTTVSTCTVAIPTKVIRPATEQVGAPSSRDTIRGVVVPRQDGEPTVIWLNDPNPAMLTANAPVSVLFWRNRAFAVIYDGRVYTEYYYQDSGNWLRTSWWLVCVLPIVAALIIFRRKLQAAIDVADPLLNIAMGALAIGMLFMTVLAAFAVAAGFCYVVV